MDNHPRSILLGAQAQTGVLPVCDHYSGIPSRMVRSLQLQAELTQEFGACVMDVTLDCEDGAPVGREADHAALVADLAAGSDDSARVAVRVHPLDHPAFAEDVRILLARAGSDKSRLLMVQIFLPDLADFDGMNAVWDAWVAPGNAPPRATVQARLARPEWKIEVVATAAVA